MLRLIAVVSMMVVCGCATVPPPSMPLEGALRAPVGTVAVRGYGIATGPDAVAAGGRVSVQVARNWAAGIEGAWGRQYIWNSLQFGPGEVLAGRVHVRRFLRDHFAFTGGIGGMRARNFFGRSPYGPDPDAKPHFWAVTADLGAVIGRREGERFEVYAGPSLSLNVPTHEPRWFGLYLQASGGANLRVTERVRLGADVTLALRLNEAFWEFPSWLMGTLSVAVLFGGQP